MVNGLIGYFYGIHLNTTRPEFFRMKKKAIKLYIYASEKLRSMTNWNEILEHASSQGYRSNIVKPLFGMSIVLFLASALFLFLGSNLLAYVSFGMAGLTFITFLISYFYCLFKNPDLLRSEKYNLEKTAIEKVSLSGDSLTKGKLLPPNMDYVKVESTIQTRNEIKNLEE